MSEDQVDGLIDDFFQENYRRLLVEGGAHVLTPRALAQARQQVEHYWKKLRGIAMTVTDTEVHLQLPNRKTPKGRMFVIEGVVDLVREADRIRMYDIKTHYCGEVQKKLPSYAAQLNVYAYIWKELRGQELHEMAVIAIQLPESLRKAIADRRSTPEMLAAELEKWNPLVPIPKEPESIEATFDEIARTVDKIEDGEFSPPPLSILRDDSSSDGGRPVTFATLHCRNCDGRFSCEAYRAYVTRGGGSARKIDLKKYLEEAHDDGELQEWIDDNLERSFDEMYEE